MSGPADSTNAGVPAAGGALSGDVAREYAIKRLERQRAAINQQNTSPTNTVTPPPTLPKVRRL